MRCRRAGIPGSTTAPLDDDCECLQSLRFDGRYLWPTIYLWIGPSVRRASCLTPAWVPLLSLPTSCSRASFSTGASLQEVSSSQIYVRVCNHCWKAVSWKIKEPFTSCSHLGIEQPRAVAGLLSLRLRTFLREVEEDNFDRSPKERFKIRESMEGSDFLTALHDWCHTASRHLH